MYPRTVHEVHNVFLLLCIPSFLKGDMFIVHNELDDGWLWVTNVRTEEQGLIVEDLVEEVVSTTHWRGDARSPGLCVIVPSQATCKDHHQ